MTGHGTTFVYIGSFFGPVEEGIRIYRWDGADGTLELVGAATDGIENPLYLDTDPRQRVLYVADCTTRWAEGNAVSAHAIDPATGSLTLLNRQPSGGMIPVHVSVSASGASVLVANCGPWEPATTAGRTVAVLPIRSDGSLGAATARITHAGAGPNPVWQTAPHPHALVLDPANRYAFAPDVGTDRIVLYRFDAEQGTLEPHQPPFITTTPGSGPRHLRFHPNGRFAYLITEIAGAVIAYAYDASSGTLTEMQTASAVPADYAGERNAAELRIHSSGRFLYASNRGHNSIALFSIGEQSGRLTPIGHVSTQGSAPRAFAIDPTGSFLLVANELSDSVLSYRIDQRTGALEPTGHVTRMPHPACLAFVRVAA